MFSDRTSHKVLKSVAFFEGAKGLIVLFAGFGLLSLLHQDLRSMAFALVGRLHLNPEHHYPSVFIAAATRLTDTDLWLAALFSCLYSGFHFVETYGLWFERTWAEWLAIASGGIYLPIELYELAVKFTWIRLSALAANVAVIVVLALILRQKRQRPAAAR